jgi:hypothetical protein
MRRSVVTLVTLLCLVGAMQAVAKEQVRLHQALAPDARDAWQIGPAYTDTRQDTVWFGGDNGNGLAVVGNVWDFETPGSNGFQGCTSRDETSNPGVYFGRVIAADFQAHGDPCVPMILGTPGMLWCGIHQDEADQRDFLAGMGYQNEMCQRAFSPDRVIAPATQAIDISFSYFNHTESDFDYTYVYVLCYDNTDDLVGEYIVASFDGIIGDAEDPAVFDEGVEVPAGVLDPRTTHIQIEFRMDADGGASDEDGNWDSPCGPFGADNIAISVGGAAQNYNFDTGAQGWTFDRCAGIGTYMHVVHDYEYGEWLADLGLTCTCSLAGDAVAFVGTICQNGPSLVPGLNERFETGTVVRTGYPGPFWNDVVVRLNAFYNLPTSTGSAYRPGFRYYPYTSEANPTPHWSPRLGQSLWLGTTAPFCTRSRISLTQMADTPLPVEWDSLRFAYEVTASCDGFGFPPSVCTEEGCTAGSPIIDGLRVGITNSADAPPITWVDGGLFHDGFGQNYPTYLEPSDRCNANISFDLSRDVTSQNDWHGDSSVVSGPNVTSAATRWLCEMCFKVARLGARQRMIPDYHAWKARLSDDPEENFVCVLMDSLETSSHTVIWRNKFATYFHEDDPAYRGPHDWNAQNEILPDQVFVPGTRIEYYWRSHWFNGGAPPQEYYRLGANPPREFECLPTMEVRPGEEYTVQWPSVLYIDAFNGNAEPFMLPALIQLGVPFDKFDYLDTATNYNCSMKRDLGGGSYNPGGYGNNGCTTEQLLGYRLVILNTGSLGTNTMEPEDFAMFDQWLSTTDCNLASTRRGFIFDGDQICAIMADEVQGYAVNFAHNVLGVTLAASAYRDYNGDAAFCVYLEPVASPQFLPAEPGVGLFGNGCPQEFNYNVLGVQPGVPNVTGNLEFWSFEQTGNQQYVDFAQVIRRNQVTGVANWRSVVNGFSFHHLSEQGCQGQPCGTDSLCRVSGTTDLYGPMIEWLANGGLPFTKWTYPCINTGVDPGENHLDGPVNYLHQSRPNPFNSRVTIRFSLASAGEVNLSVYDVAGRLVKTLLSGDAPAGENAIVWDGMDNRGHRVGGGVFWMQMTTSDGYISVRKMIALR